MAAWLVVAALVGVLIGRVIRGRERQLPTDGPPAANPRIPAQGRVAHPTGPPVQRDPQGR